MSSRNLYVTKQQRRNFWQDDAKYKPGMRPIFPVVSVRLLMTNCWLKEFAAMPRHGFGKVAGVYFIGVMIHALYFLPEKTLHIYSL